MQNLSPTPARMDPPPRLPRPPHSLTQAQSPILRAGSIIIDVVTPLLGINAVLVFQPEYGERPRCRLSRQNERSVASTHEARACDQQAPVHRRQETHQILNAHLALPC